MSVLKRKRPRPYSGRGLLHSSITNAARAAFNYPLLTINCSLLNGLTRRRSIFLLLLTLLLIQRIEVDRLQHHLRE